MLNKFSFKKNNKNTKPIYNNIPIMEGIYNATDEFPFSQLLLLKPTAVPGGNYFIKFRMNELPLYIQTPKCNTKQGILKAGKKYFSDLMFTNEHEIFIQWIEKLENYSQKYIYDHREMWFDTELDLHDIENSFSSCVKLYKSGKYYLVRTHIPTQLGKCSLKIYNENEELVDPEEITDKNDVVTILEIQGIKCSARSFQIEIEIKQMLVLPNNNLFEKCILVKGKSRSEPPHTSVNKIALPKGELLENSELSNDNSLLDDNEYLGKTPENTILQQDSHILSNTSSSNDISESEFSKNTEMLMKTPQSTDNDVDDDIEEEYEENPDELKEIDLSLDEIPETEQIQIKTRNDVYYKMYQDAKKKAKLAKDLALSAYLEAKHIKNTYMLEDLDDSDSDLEEDSFYEKQE
uniref:Uncharacterized protein n=1 Tax=viral metagenome TaxID=1070528 RepID=A0A6C0JZS3_9ZZZZ